MVESNEKVNKRIINLQKMLPESGVPAQSTANTRIIDSPDTLNISAGKLVKILSHKTIIPYAIDLPTS